MDHFGINKLLEIAGRRKYWFIIPFLAALLGGMGYFLNAPRLYEGRAVVLVQSQSVPKDYVKPIVAEGMPERLATISQEVKNRTNLEAVAREYGLWSPPSESGGSPTLDRVIDELQKRITISIDTGKGRGSVGISGIRGATAFIISFLGEDPEKVMKVTNALAYKYISENLEFRQTQVKGTTAFLSDEIESVRERLMQKEAELKTYRESNMGGLPEQLNANLTMLQRSQSRAEQLSRNLSDLENRKLLLQQNLEEMRKARDTAVVSPGGGRDARDLPSLKSELLVLEARYTANHPDVVRLRKLIETLEAVGTAEGAGSAGGRVRISREEQALVQQLHAVDMDIAKTKTEMSQTQGEIALYQQRIEDTPRREQELTSVKRDYTNLKELYDSLLARKMEADIALNMETKQKSEQFRILEPAKLPTFPAEPNVKKILLMILAVGIGLGGGLAYFRETLDTSFKTPEEAGNELDVPVLVSTPFRFTEQELRKRKFRKTVFAGSVAAGFVVCAAAIVLFSGGVDGALADFKMLMGVR